MTQERSPEERFMTAVKDQAEARKDMDFQAFLAYFLPEAMAGMRSTMAAAGGRRQLPRPGQIERFEILETRLDGDKGQSAVRYSGYGSFVLQQDWVLTEAGWRVSKMERPEELVTKPSLRQRLQQLPQAFATVRMSRPPGGGMMGRR